MMLILSLLLAAADTLRPLQARDWIYLDYDYHRQAWALTCFDYTNDAASRRFNRLFGRRMQHVRSWSEKRFTAAALEAVRRQEFPDGFVMVGGCRGGWYPERVEREFRDKLLTVERRIKAEDADED